MIFNELDMNLFFKKHKDTKLEAKDTIFINYKKINSIIFPNLIRAKDILFNNCSYTDFENLEYCEGFSHLRSGKLKKINFPKLKNCRYINLKDETIDEVYLPEIKNLRWINTNAEKINLPKLTICEEFNVRGAKEIIIPKLLYTHRIIINPNIIKRIIVPKRIALDYDFKIPRDGGYGFKNIDVSKLNIDVIYSDEKQEFSESFSSFFYR